MKKYLIAATAASLLAATAIGHAQTANSNTNNSKMQATDSATTSTNKMQSPDANKTPATGNSTTQASPNTSAQMKTPSASANTTGMQTDTMHGITMGKTPSGAIRYGQANTGDLMTSKLIGVDVYNSQNEKIGEISDLTLDNGKTLSGVVVSVGGFLGMGEHYVLIEPSSIALNDDNGTWKAYVNTTKDNLKAAPTFSYKAHNRS